LSDVLIVEDQAQVARLLLRWVEAEGATAVAATSAEQALLLASQQTPAVALCDVNLPGGRDGFWLAEQLRALHPETAVVMTTGLHYFDAAVAGLRAGVVDYVTKPVSRERLQEALRRALAEHQSRKASSSASESTSDQSGGYQGAPGAKAALLTVLHAQGGAAVHHAQHAADVAAKLARALSLAGRDVALVEYAALLCHIDRVDVHGLARKVPDLSDASAIALASQERFDGSGFPLGLRGSAIPRGARIVAVANAYDALVTGSGGVRVTPEQAVEILCHERAGQFDPAVLRALRISQRELR